MLNVGGLNTSENVQIIFHDLFSFFLWELQKN